MSVPNSHAQRDPLLKTTKALPAAAASNNHDGINLESGSNNGQFPTNRGMALELYVPALPALVDAKTVTFTPKDSADGVTYAAIPELAPLVLTGAGGVGIAVPTTRVWPLPGSTRQYVRVDQDVLAAGGNNTGVTSEVQVLLSI